MRILPHSGAFSLAASRMAWPLDKVEKLTIHGRDMTGLALHLYPGAQLLVLSKNGASPHAVANMLVARRAGKACLSILEHLGGDKERIDHRIASDLANDPLASFADLNCLAIEIPADFSCWQPRLAGLSDDAFEHDGKMTKQDIRASALAKLAPFPGAVLWDVGTGCGSVAIEWMRSGERCRAIGFDMQAKRLAFARHNAQALGVPHLELVEGRAPDCLSGHSSPDAVFIGGAVTEDVIKACQTALRPGGRLVAHAVTLQSEQILLAHFEAHGGALIRLSVARAEPVGPFHGWRAAMPVTQWVWHKPFAASDTISNDMNEAVQ